MNPEQVGRSIGDQMPKAMMQGIVFFLQLLLSIWPLFAFLLGCCILVRLLKEVEFRLFYRNRRTGSGTTRESYNRGLMDAARMVQGVLSLNWTQFECLCCLLFENQGYETRVTQRMNDEGIDLIASKDGLKIVAQCKRFTNWSVGRPTVQQLYGAMIDAGADHAYLLTTSRFSHPAREFARGKPMTLVDKNELTMWISRYGSEIGSEEGSEPADSSNREPAGEIKQIKTYVCAACGAPTTLPFQPTKGKPVYCRECYAKRWKRSTGGRTKE